MKNIRIAALASAVALTGRQPADEGVAFSDVRLVSAADGAAPCP